MATYDDVLDAAFLGRLRAFVRRRAPSAQDADDVVQDAMLALLAKGGAVPAASARAWMFTVARHAAVDRWRGRSRTASLPDDPAGPPDAEDPPDGAEVVAYLAGCLEPLLRALPPTDADLLRRVDVADTPQADIAREAGLATSTVKSRVQRARRRLRDLLEGCCAVERDRRGTPIAYRRRDEATCPCAPPEEPVPPGLGPGAPSSARRVAGRR